MPANGESRGDAHSPVGVSITFQQDVNWISFSLLDLCSPVPFFFYPPPPPLSLALIVYARFVRMAAYFISNLLRRLITVLRYFCRRAENARHVERQRETWFENRT